MSCKPICMKTLLGSQPTIPLSLNCKTERKTFESNCVTHYVYERQTLFKLKASTLVSLIYLFIIHRVEQE